MFGMCNITLGESGKQAISCLAYAEISCTQPNWVKKQYIEQNK